MLCDVKMQYGHIEQNEKKVSKQIFSLVLCKGQVHSNVESCRNCVEDQVIDYPSKESFREAVWFVSSAVSVQMFLSRHHHHHNNEGPCGLPAFLKDT